MNGLAVEDITDNLIKKYDLTLGSYGRSPAVICGREKEFYDLQLESFYKAEKKANAAGKELNFNYTPEKLSDRYFFLMHKIFLQTEGLDSLSQAFLR